MKHPITPEKAAIIFEDVQLMKVLAEVILIAHRNHLYDHRFKSPAVNNHAKRIKESSEAISIHLSSIVKTKDREYLSNEHCASLLELFKYFITMPMEAIQENLDKINQLKQEINQNNEK